MVGSVLIIVWLPMKAQIIRLCLKVHSGYIVL
jgi:hypothetical protein